MEYFSFTPESRNLAEITFEPETFVFETQNRVLIQDLRKHTVNSRGVFGCYETWSQKRQKLKFLPISQNNRSCLCNRQFLCSFRYDNRDEFRQDDLNSVIFYLVSAKNFHCAHVFVVMLCSRPCFERFFPRFLILIMVGTTERTDVFVSFIESFLYSIKRRRRCLERCRL